ncbi:sulfatase-like hydrolase/transferase [Arthrobacter sp. R1-13]
MLKNCFATNALCSPSRPSILTGTYSHINGVTTLETQIDAGASRPHWSCSAHWRCTGATSAHSGRKWPTQAAP